MKVTHIKEEDKKLPGEVFKEIGDSLISLKMRTESILKEDGLSQDLRDKYRKVSEDLSIVSAYFQYRAKTAKGDIPLYKFEGGVLIEFVDSLRRLPDQIISEMTRDRGLADPDSEDWLVAEMGTGKLAELANTISKYILQRVENNSLFPEEIPTEKKRVEIETKEDYLLQVRSNIVAIYVTFNAIDKEIKEFELDKSSQKNDKEYKEISRFIEETVLPNLREALNTITDKLSLDQIRQKYEWTRITVDQILDILADKEKDKVPTPGGRKVLLGLKAQRPESTALRELKKLLKAPKPRAIVIQRDIVKSQIESVGDILEIGSNEDKKLIEKLQSEGKLLFGTMEGLSEGNAYFKSFSIALAKILNEQVKYYQTEKDWRGVPEELITQIWGESAEIEKESGDCVPVAKPKERIDHLTIQGEDRPFPYVLISYRRLAEYMSKTGKVSGGEDIEGIKRYINGGYTEFKEDPKTGKKKPVKSSYVPGLVSRKYPVSTGGNIIYFLPLIVNEGEIVDYTKKDPEVGCILRLSPQYSKGVKLNYVSFRSDTIQLIGGGKQRDITMDLLTFLVNTRGIKDSTNGNSLLKINKNEILARYKDKPTYSGRPGKLEKHYKEAVRKAIDAKVLLPGEDKSGRLYGYREEKNTRGEVFSIFVFNPDYLKENPTDEQ